MNPTFICECCEKEYYNTQKLAGRCDYCDQPVCGECVKETRSGVKRKIICRLCRELLDEI